MLKILSVVALGLTVTSVSSCGHGSGLWGGSKCCSSKKSSKHCKGKKCALKKKRSANKKK